MRERFEPCSRPLRLGERIEVLTTLRASGNESRNREVSFRANIANSNVHCTLIELEPRRIGSPCETQVPGGEPERSNCSRSHQISLTSRLQWKSRHPPRP